MIRGLPTERTIAITYEFTEFGLLHAIQLAWRTIPFRGPHSVYLEGESYERRRRSRTQLEGSVRQATGHPGRGSVHGSVSAGRAEGDFAFCARSIEESAIPGGLRTGLCYSRSHQSRDSPEPEFC